jgi:hypothetical protein
MASPTPTPPADLEYPKKPHPAPTTTP